MPRSFYRDTVDRPRRDRLNLSAGVLRRRWGAVGAADVKQTSRRRERKLMMRILIAAAAVLAVSTGTALAQDAAKGEHSFNKCLPCHSIGPDAQNKIGPVLNGLDGRHSGSVANFNYSDANKNSGIVWNETTFKQYIQDPKAMVPGTKMIFAGVKNPQEVDDLWAYIKQFDADGDVKK
jgi:cytochrome c